MIYSRSSQLFKLVTIKSACIRGGCKSYLNSRRIVLFSYLHFFFSLDRLEKVTSNFFSFKKGALHVLY
jgi:hypothetical protein